MPDQLTFNKEALALKKYEKELLEIKIDNIEKHNAICRKMWRKIKFKPNKISLEKTKFHDKIRKLNLKLLELEMMEIEEIIKEELEH